METLSRTVRKGSESVYEKIEQTMSPFTSRTGRCQHKSSRSPGGPRGSIASSIDSMISGARNSVSELLDDLADRKEDTVSNLKRMIHLSPDKREERRNSIRRRYRDLYYSKTKCAYRRSTFSSETDEAVLLEDLAVESDTTLSGSVKQAQNNLNQDKIIENDTLLSGQNCGVCPLSRNRGRAFGKIISCGSAGDKVQHWVSSSLQISPEGTSENNNKKMKVEYRKSNSDSLKRRYILQATMVGEVGQKIRTSDSKLRQTINREDLENTFKFHSARHREVSLSSLGSLDNIFLQSADNISTEAIDEKSSVKQNSLEVGPVRKQLNGKIRTKELVSIKQEKCPNDMSRSYVDGAEKPFKKGGIVGTINIAVQFLDESNKLKVTIEGISILDKDPSYTLDMKIFVKIYMTFRNTVEKKCSKSVKRKYISFFNKDVYLPIKNTESATQPFIRLKVCGPKPLFSVKRHTSIAETSFYLNKADLHYRKEISKLLNTCI